MSFRLLITGSRAWTNKDRLYYVLETVWNNQILEGERPKNLVLVSGACPTGADRMCEEVWSKFGGTIERHPADWEKHGRSAGFKRNQAMVDKGADLCIAFIKSGSAGASHTAKQAEKAGIITVRFEE